MRLCDSEQNIKPVFGSPEAGFPFADNNTGKKVLDRINKIDGMLPDGKEFFAMNFSLFET